MELSLSGVGVLDKAMLILDALEEGPADLAELMEKTGLPRATAHRLAGALEAHHLVERRRGGPYRLGPRLTELGQAAGIRPYLSLAELAGPVLAHLRDHTQESAQLYVRSGNDRVCIAAVESPQGLRTIIAVGAVLPLNKGSAGKVLAGNAPDGWAESVEEREPGVASVSAPVFKAGEMVAAISVSGPIGRTTRQPGFVYAERVMAAARELSVILEGAPTR